MARFRLRRNSQTGTAPANGVLLEGEVALNTLDGRLFYGRPDGTTGLLKPLMADLATGNPSSNTYLNGAGVWSVPLNAVAPPPTGVLLPLYLFPTSVYTNTTYNALEALIKRYRSVPIYIVLNPSNGLGTVTATDANYTAAIKRLRGAGAKILGYLDSNTGVNTSAQILAQAATYNSFYPTAPMDGFLIDRLTNTDTQPPVDLLSATTLALHNQGFYPIIGNAGSALPERYFLNPAADSLIIHENNFYPTQATLQGDFAGGNADYDPRKRAALVYGQAFNAANVEIMRQFAGLIYTTQTVTPNQYAVPSADLELLLQTILAAQASGLSRKLDPANSGVIAPAILGTGTPTANTYLNGLGAWTSTAAFARLDADNTFVGNNAQKTLTLLSQSGGGYSSTFTQADGPLPAEWVRGTTFTATNPATMTALGGAATLPATTGADGMSYLPGYTMTDGSVQATLTRGGGILARYSTNGAGYLLAMDGPGSIYLVRETAGVGEVVLASNTVLLPTSGVFKLTVTGSSLQAYLNGSLILSATDSTYASGSPGIFGVAVAGNSVDNFSYTPASGGQTSNPASGYAMLYVESNVLKSRDSTGAITTYGAGGAAATVGNPVYANITAAYTISATDYYLFASAATAAFSATLPTAVGIGGKSYTLKKTDASANAVTLATTLAQTIDGGTTAVISYQYNSLTVVSDGSNWQVV